MADDWKLLHLGDVTENHDGRRVPVKGADRKPGPYPYYGASGIVDYVSDYIFDGEYLLIAEDGENLRTRKTPIAFMANGRFWVNNHAHIVRGNDRADTRFLCYYLTHADVSGYLTGSTMPKLTQGAMNRIPVWLPPLDEQRRIAATLGALDDKIELNRKMNRTLEDMAQALFKSWFIDFDGHDDLVDSEIGPVPRGWEVKPIGDAVKVVGGSTPSTKEPAYWEGGTHAWATPKDLSGLAVPVLLGTERQVTDAGLQKISSGVLPAGTFLLSSRAPIGYTAISQVPTAINQGFIAIPPGGELTAAYLLFWTRFNMDTIKGRAGGTTFAEISKAAFRPIPVVVPPQGRLGEFERVVGPLIDRIVANARESVTLTDLRDTLLPKLISGELRVPEAEDAVGPAPGPRSPSAAGEAPLP